VDNFYFSPPNFVPQFYEYLIALNRYLHIVFIGICLLVFLGNKVQAQHPIGYGSLKSTSQVGTFSFIALDRAIVTEKKAAIFAPNPMSITFEVLVTAAGEVKYVRSPRLSSELSELRLACTSALYGFAFAPVDATVGEKWFKATLICEDLDIAE
jgi:hypothetical protein